VIRDDNSEPIQTPPATPAPAPQATPAQAASAQPAAGQPAQAESASAQPAAAQEGAGPSRERRIDGIRDLAIWDTAKADEFRHRWHDVQTHFVENPRGSVAEARQLVDEATQALTASVHEREEELERGGARSSDSTEGMRDTVLQYHQLLDRLLAV